MARVVSTPVLDIELEEAGPADGRPVLLLHGWPDAPRGWGPVAERLHADGLRTLVPALRGSGGTRFRSADTPRDGRGAALAAALALPYQPRGAFTMPGFEQARAFWYQWLMYVDAGAETVAADPVGFARVQWDTWSPPGWFDEDEFAATARSFANPDWVRITLNAYRTRFSDGEPRDPRYDPLVRRLAEIETVTTPTLMIQGGDDRCDEPAGSEDQERFFSGGYERIVLDGVGHFPHREAPDAVAAAVSRHLRDAR